MYEDPTYSTSASPIPRMKVNVVLTDLDNPYFLVDEWYSKEELNGVWKEIDFLTDFKKFKLDDEQLLSINLDDSYNNKNISNIFLIFFLGSVLVMLAPGGKTLALILTTSLPLVEFEEIVIVSWILIPATIYFETP